MSERITIDPVPTPRRTRRAGWIAAAAATGLLLATPVLAHGGAWGGGRGGAWGCDATGAAPTHPMVGMGPGGGMEPGAGWARGGMPFGGAQRFGATGPRAMVPGMLQQLPLGTEVTAALYAADPADGAPAAATLAAVVGETSEAAFAQELASAAEDAAFVVVEIGPHVRRVDLSDAGLRAPLASLGRRTGHLDFGDTIEIALYAQDGDAAPSATLSFTYGEDSEAAFRAELAEAAADAAVAEVALPARTRTVDLSARPLAGTPDGDGPGLRMPGRGR